MSILCLDFDGVLHWYRNGWKGIDVIDDTPVPGAVEFVEEAKKHFKVVIFSSRCREAIGILAIEAWLKEYSFPEVDVVDTKPPAFISLDDRTLTFRGVFPDPESLLDFKPWNK